MRGVNLRMTVAQWQMMAAQLTRELPNEACGLLAGVEGGVQCVYAIENIRRSPVAYLMQAEQQIRAMMEMEERGWELTAIYHSHPAGPPTPSPTDIAEAYYPEALYLICSADARGVWHGRAFRIVNGSATEVPMEIVE